MLQWFQRLMPHQDVFFPAFERHAAVIVKAAMALRQMVVDGDQLKLRFEEILALEHEADSIARDVLLGLRTTFITPFDRDDIQSLIKKSLRKSRIAYIVWLNGLAAIAVLIGLAHASLPADQVKRFADAMLVFGAGSLAGLASAFFLLISVGRSDLSALP